MQKLKFTQTAPGCDRRHYITEDEVLVVLSRLPEDTWQRLRAVHFTDQSKGARVLGYVHQGRREISVCALPPRVSLTRCLIKGQSCAEFGAKRGTQWPQLAVRRFMLYDVLLHELGHLQLINMNAKSDRLKYAHEKLAEQFANEWRRKLWAVHFDHLDPVHNAPISAEHSVLETSAIMPRANATHD
jgi:hypothetical protein